ncbi:THO complex subunit 2, partial [Fasciola gigantica]
HNILQFKITSKKDDFCLGNKSSRLKSHCQLYPPDVSIHSARTRLLSAAKTYRPSAPPNLCLSNSAAMNTSLNSIIVADMATNDAPGGAPCDAFKRSILIGKRIRIRVYLDMVLTPWMPNNTNRNLDDAPMERTGDHGPANAANFDSTDEKECDTNVDALYENNQKLELCAALIRHRDWTNAQAILDRFTGYWATGYKPLNHAVCELLHYLIEPLYTKVCPLPSGLQRSRRRVFDIPARNTESGSQTDSSNLLHPVYDFAKLTRIVLPIAGYLGPNMSTDVVLMVKFCRLGYAYLSSQTTNTGTVEAVYQGFFNLLDEVLLPSLSLVEANCCLAEEIWQLLRFMPYDHRYRLYGQWKHTTCQNEPSVIRRRARVTVCTKAILKRLSKENIKPMGRQLGKLSHNNPGLLFDHLLNTVQMYINIIGPVVEALKYVSSLGYDVLTFCIIEALAADDSKLEDVQFGQRLQALSTFTGLLCKKYQFDLAGILQYVLNQLKAGKSFDLLILREILHRMSGIDVIEEMTDEQVESMSGGELLLQEGGYYSQIRNTRKNATRLKEALMEHNMIMPFIFLMARQRDAVLFLDDPERHVKIAGRLYDQCQGTLVQFITFLSLQLTREEMETQCLPIEQMMGEFHVPADTAFCLHRSVFEQRVALIKLCISLSIPFCFQFPVQLLSTFYYISVYGLVRVTAHRSIQRLFETKECSDELKLSEKSKSASKTSAKKKRELDRLQGLIDRLSAEQSERLEHVSRVRAWLLAERDTWFQTRLVTKTDTITQFLQLCIYPRVCYTTADAIYAAQFMHVLHQLKTSRFSTLICLDRIFNDITLPISMCTEDEAHRYGRFLCAVLELVTRWHTSEEIFNQECGQFPGFVTVFRKGSDANTKADQLQYENYRHVVHKWHYRITKATVACLESGSYVQIRNALIVLTRILPQYPQIIQFGSAVERRVHKLKDEEKDRRPDLKTLAFSYAGLVRFRKSKWVNEEDFHVKENKTIRSEPISSIRSINTITSTSATNAVLHPNRVVPTSGAEASGSSAITSRSGPGTGASGMSNGTHITAVASTNTATTITTISASTANESSHGNTGPKRSIGHPPTQRATVIQNDSRGRSNISTSSTAPEVAMRTMPPASSTVSVSAPSRGQSSPIKQRPIYRSEPTVPAQSNDLTSTPVLPPTASTTEEQQQITKRRRMDANTAASSTAATPTSFSSGNAVAAKVINSASTVVSDDTHDARKMARKRVVAPTPAVPEPTPVANEAGVRPNSKPSGGSATVSMQRSASGDRSHPAPPISSSSGQSRHQVRRGHRASSSNSADSREDDERSQSSSGKKIRRAHHHHHRHSTESTGISPMNAVYSPVRTTAPNENLSSSSAALSSSSRHSRK